MKILKRILIGFLLLIIVALIIGYFYFRHISHRALPDYNQYIHLKNIQSRVTVYRDQFATPHIYASNEEDLYRAVGYVMAQDRLWQMDLLRRVTTGRLAELFGENLLSTDQLMRSLRITKKSKQILSKLNPKIVKCLAAFTDGVNQYMNRIKEKLPPEFFILGYQPEPWQIWHSINLVGYMAWDLNLPWDLEFLLYKISKKVSPQKFKEMIPNLSLNNPPVFLNWGTPATQKDVKRKEFEPTNKISWDQNKVLERSTVDYFLAHPGEELNALLLKVSKNLNDLGLVVFFGSNNWAISGDKSITGKPIMANDMHLGLFTPGIWYPMHQVVENEESPINVTGVVLPGQPFVIAGHNKDIAWGMTNVMIDDLDFFEETINPENSKQYRFNHHWENMETQIEVFKTREGKTIRKELLFTHRGPIISELKSISGKVISMSWIGNYFSNEIRSIYLLNRAKNWGEFRDALKTFISISQNIVYADINGNIGLQMVGGIPIREGNGIQIASGETDQFDWKGIVPFEALPFCYNPESGYVASANNKTVGDDYPYYISYWFALPERINRIREGLEEKSIFSIREMQLLQTDVKSLHVERFLKDIIEILQSQMDLNDIENQALQLLKNWDGVLHQDSVATTIFENLYIELVKNLVKDELGENELFREYIGKRILIRNLMINIWNNKNSQWCDDVNTEMKEDFNHWVTDSFKNSINKMSQDLGKDPKKWQWGKIHQLILGHPLGRVKLLDWLFSFNRGPYPVGGSFHTVCPYSYPIGKSFISDHGASQRHIYSTANWDDSMTVIPTGISGIPASPYYCDQTQLYIENKYHRDFSSKKMVIENSKYKMIISKK